VSKHSFIDSRWKIFQQRLMPTKLNYDNQIVFADRKEVISNGNFHGEYPAKVCYLRI